MADFETIEMANLDDVTGGLFGWLFGSPSVKRAPQVGFNGAIVGGQALGPIERTPQVGYNGAIVGGDRKHIY